MDQNDRQAIEGLFGKLSEVERTAGPRDEEAEALIRDQVARQPASPYFMAQTIVVQEQALNAAQQRIEDLEYELSSRPQSGGLFSSLFGGGSRPAQPAPMQRQMSAAPAQEPASGPWGQQGGQQRGGGFLAGAAQTAMGVAGGVLLGNAIAGMFAGDANAADKADSGSQENNTADDGGAEDVDTGGLDDLDF